MGAVSTIEVNVVMLLTSRRSILDQLGRSVLAPSAQPQLDQGRSIREEYFRS